LPYILSAALIDGKITPEQYMPKRIGRSDVQSLLRKVQVSASKEFSSRFPDTMPCKITVHLKSGKTVTRAVDDYEGFLTRPMIFEQATEKFNSLTSKFVGGNRRKRIIDAVSQLENIKIRQIMELLTLAET
jgi:2-methylcitrate dehydratase